MKFYYHFNAAYLANSYLLVAEDSKDVVLIDPGVMDVALLQLVEENAYYVRSILVTHAGAPQVSGIKTILKIYDSVVYSANSLINDVPCTVISDGDFLDLFGLRIETIGVQAFARDALLFKIRNFLFTGDALTAGLIGHVPNTYGRALLVESLKERLLSMDPNTLIFPGFGPPTRVGIEKEFNPDLRIRP